MSFNFKHLNKENIPEPLTKEGMDWMQSYSFTKQTKIWVEIKYHNPEYLLWLETIGLSITDIELFLNPANHSMPIHIDGNELHDEFKLNFAYNPRGNSLMNWFSPHKEAKAKKEGVLYANQDARPINTKDLYWYPEEVDLIDSADIDVAIVQVGQPHNVKTTFSPRKCLSCVFDKILIKDVFTTNEAILKGMPLETIAIERDKAVNAKILQDIVTMPEAIELFKDYII
jgi:hypothetical protein